MVYLCDGLALVGYWVKIWWRGFCDESSAALMWFVGLFSLVVRFGFLLFGSRRFVLLFSVPVLAYVCSPGRMCLFGTVLSAIDLLGVGLFFVDASLLQSLNQSDCQSKPLLCCFLSRLYPPVASWSVSADHSSDLSFDLPNRV